MTAEQKTMEVSQMEADIITFIRECKPQTQELIYRVVLRWASSDQGFAQPLKPFVIVGGGVYG